MRYERKYRIEQASLGEVLQSIRLNPACFQTAFPDRYINSIYLDDFNFSFLQENLSGISSRSKYRIRWYGDLLNTISDPKLEIKIKNNFVNRKETRDLPDFILDNHFDCAAYLQKNLALRERLFPVSIIRYLRSYFVSQNGKVRATVDRELTYFLYQGKLLLHHSPARDKAIILEVKYDKAYDNYCQEVFQNFPFRMSKNSKYVSSIAAHY